MKGIPPFLAVPIFCFGFVIGLVSAIDRPVAAEPEPAPEPFKTHMVVLPDTTRCAVITQGGRPEVMDCDWKWRDRPLEIGG